MRSSRPRPIFIWLGAIHLICGLLAGAMGAHWIGPQAWQGIAHEIQELKEATPELRGSIGAEKSPAGMDHLSGASLPGVRLGTLKAG